MRAPVILLAGSLLLAANAAGADAQAYLDLPSIAGTASLPGYPDVIPVVTFQSIGQTLHVAKMIDRTSPALFAAELEGTIFPVAEVLLYEGASTRPTRIYQFTDAVISSFSDSSGSGYEQLGISFVSERIVSVVPEPSALATMLVALLAAGLATGRKKPRTTDVVRG